MSADISSHTSRSTYRPTLNWYVDQHIGQHLAGCCIGCCMLNDTSVDSRSICRGAHKIHMIHQLFVKGNHKIFDTCIYWFSNFFKVNGHTSNAVVKKTKTQKRKPKIKDPKTRERRPQNTKTKGPWTGKRIYPWNRMSPKRWILHMLIAFLSTGFPFLEKLRIQFLKRSPQTFFFVFSDDKIEGMCTD